MHGCRSRKIELAPFDSEIKRTFKKGLKQTKIQNSLLEMGENTVKARTLRDYFSPITTDPPSCIVLPTTTAAQFEIKPQIFQLLPNFYGMDSEDPYMHIKDFLEIWSTFKFQDFSDESVRLRSFPFSLKDI